MTMAPQLILASASPRRRELLAWAGVNFRAVSTTVDESSLPDEDAAAHVLRLAEAKAGRAAEDESGVWILAADTVVVLDGMIMGKPRDRDHAAHMLERLSGRTHRVITGFCLLNRESGVQVSEAVETEVTFRKLTGRDIETYIDSGEVWDKAGAYAIQGRGAFLVRHIRGSYTNVIGLPLAEVLTVMNRRLPHFSSRP